MKTYTVIRQITAIGDAEWLDTMDARNLPDGAQEFLTRENCHLIVKTIRDTRKEEEE